MFERYTERARRVIFFARYEASQFGSPTIESEHLLLGLLREDRNIVGRFLANASAESIRDQAATHLTIKEKVATSVDLPLSQECRHILEYAAQEAEKLSHKFIGTEHLLLGILREEGCGAARVLSERGLKIDALRQGIAASPVAQEQETLAGRLAGMFYRHVAGSGMLQNPSLPKAGVVPDAATAMRIAEAAWLPLYDVDTIESQRPFTAELKFNVWVVTGKAAVESALFAFILQMDGRMLSVGRGMEKMA